MNIIITGAASFIGKALIRKLAVPGNFIYAVVRKYDGNSAFLCKEKYIKLLECPMENYYMLEKMIGGCCDGMIHLAWEGTRGEVREDFFLQNRNRKLSVKALNQAVALGCKWIVLAGSQAEYGVYPDQPIFETMQSRPQSAYGNCKLSLYNDALVLCKKKGIRLLEPRFFSIYGPGDWKNSLIMTCLKKMTANKECNLTECIQYWNYLYINDAAEGVLSLIRNENTAGVYNLASSDTRVLKDFIYEMYDLTGSKSSLNFGAVSYGRKGMVSIMPDCSKIETETGWKADTSFAAGIEEILKNDIYLS